MSIRLYERMVRLALGFCLLAALACAGGSAAEDQSPEAKGSTELVELRIELPPPYSAGCARSDILDPAFGKPRGPFMVPADVFNVSAGKSVTASSGAPIIGTLEGLTDGIKSPALGEVGGRASEFVPSVHWIQVDFGTECEVFAVVLWHYYGQSRVYHDIVVHISNDSEFQEGVSTIYNNDRDNSAGLGAGKDWEWIETNEGRLMDARGAKGRYLRCYSNGNTRNNFNHYVEIEAYGRPVKP